MALATSCNDGNCIGQCKIKTEILGSSRHISRKNVNEIFSIAQEKGLTYQSVKDLLEDEVYELIYPDKYKRMTDNLYTLPDYSHIHSEHKRVGG